MEVTNHEVGESHLPATNSASEAAALDIIRTETVLSRMPVHNLAKRGNVNIQILKTTAEGKVELKWIVSYSDRYGQARQLAYKLDTIVINHHIDEEGRPLPKMICLGSLRDIADQLDLGGDTNKVRRALRQNASAFITAKFEMMVPRKHLKRILPGTASSSLASNFRMGGGPTRCTSF